MKQNKITYNHQKIVNIYIVYEISKSTNISNYVTLENWLFGAVGLIKNADIDKYGHSGYGIGFDRHGIFSFPGIGLDRNAIIFGADLSWSTKIDNTKKYISILGKGPTKGLENTLSAEKMYSIDFKGNNKKLCLNFYYNGENSSLFVNSKEIFKFTAKNSEIVAIPLWLGNFLKDWH